VEHFDVAIVGARCAGSPLATMLARRGLRICLLDRSSFPSETLSTHVIQPCGVAVLDRLGLLDAILAAGAVPLTRFSLTTDQARIDTAIGAGGFDHPGLCIRRIALDHLLVEAAAEAGATVRTETAATALLFENGRVAGVETKEGALRARLVVGADGRTSTVASSVGAAEYYVAPPDRLFAWAYFEEAAETEGHLRLGSLGELAFVASPTDSGLYMAAVCPPLSAKDVFLADRAAGFMAGLGFWPELAGLLDGANRVGPIRVMASWHGYFREAAGPGWALLGDAGHFKDPSPAQGIADALRGAERMAETIEAGLGGASNLDEELRRWWRWRDEDGYEMHWFATDLGAVSPPTPLADQFICDVAGDEEASEGLLRVLNHDIPPSQLLTTRRIGRAAARVVRHRPAQIPAMVREGMSELRNQASRSRERRRQTTSGTERLLLVLTVLGFLVPNALVILFFAEEGLDLSGYFSLWTASTPSTQLLLDLTIAALAFFAWAAVEGPRAQIKRWWLCIPATLLVGLCFGLPLFLLMRERTLDRPSPAA
jgi:menaquinone-9 beta-reductase